MNLKITLMLLISLSFIENGIAQSGGGVFLPTDDSFKNESGLPATMVNILSREKIKTIGSEYIDDGFSEAIVDKSSKHFGLRYNNYTGYFEYKRSETEIISLSRDKYKEIDFKDGRKYFLKKYQINKTEKQDYLLAVGSTDTKIKLYKLESVEYIPYKEALSSYQEQKLPEYKVKKPLYFIEYESNIFPIEKSKDLEKAFPKHAKEIKKLASQKAINFNSDEVILFQNFLNSIL